MDLAPKFDLNLLWVLLGFVNFVVVVGVVIAGVLIYRHLTHAGGRKGSDNPEDRDGE